MLQALDFHHPVRVLDANLVAVLGRVYELESPADDAVLDLAALAEDGAVAEEAPRHDAALLDVDVVHDDAVGEADLLVDPAVGAEDGVLQGRLAGDVGALADLALGAHLERWAELRVVVSFAVWVVAFRSSK